MIGASSTWYAISARLRTSRSSAARAAAVVVLEDAKELLGTVDDRVGLLRFEPGAVVDPAPGDGDREHSGGLGGTDVEGRVADVGGRGRVGTEPFRAEEERLRVWLVPLGLVAADDRLEEMPERDVGEGELDSCAALRRDDAETASFLVEAHEHIIHSFAGLEIVVERLVVSAVDVDEPFDLIGRERAHLRLEAGAADGLHQLLV